MIRIVDSSRSQAGCIAKLHTGVGASGGTVGSEAQDGRFRVRFPAGSLETLK